MFSRNIYTVSTTFKTNTFTRPDACLLGESCLLKIHFITIYITNITWQISLYVFCQPLEK